MHTYPDRPERFTLCPQVLCAEPLSGRCYWEAEWSGCKALLGAVYKCIERKGSADVSGIGANGSSWALECSTISGYKAWHGERRVEILVPRGQPRRVGVFLDRPSGTLSFYSVSSASGQLTHLHTFREAFTEPLYAGFWVAPECSVALCKTG